MTRQRPTRRRSRPPESSGRFTARVTAWTALPTTLLLGLVLVTGAPFEACNDAPGAQCDRVFADFDSPQLQRTDDGSPIATFDNGSASGLVAVDGRLTHGLPLSRAAGYLEVGLAAPVTRVGAIVSFHSQNSGAVGLIAWSKSTISGRTRQPPDPIPNGGIHFAATNTDWILGIWDSTQQNVIVLLNGTLALAADGTEYAFEVERYGDTVAIRLPDGAMRTTRDPRVAEWSGAWACWELYENDASKVPATISSIWAAKEPAS